MHGIKNGKEHVAAWRRKKNNEDRKQDDDDDGNKNKNIGNDLIFYVG